MTTTCGRRIGIVTGEARPALTADSRTVLATLANQGFECRPVVWRDATVDWAAYDALVVRSCWEYYAHRTAFQDWLRTVTDAGVTLLNAPALVRWNMHKFSLQELEVDGVDVLPTAYVDQGSDVDIGEYLRHGGGRTPS